MKKFDTDDWKLEVVDHSRLSNLLINIVLFVYICEYSVLKFEQSNYSSIIRS